MRPALIRYMVRLDIATGDWSRPTCGLCAIVEISGRKQDCATQLPVSGNAVQSTTHW
jgi:hypothetical protein